MFALTNRAPVAGGATAASRARAVPVPRVSIAAPAARFSCLYSVPPKLATTQRTSTTTNSTARDVATSAGRTEVKGESTRLSFKKGDPTNFALGILGDLHMDPRDLTHSFEGREHVKAALAVEENTFVVGIGNGLDRQTLAREGSSHLLHCNSNASQFAH